MKDPESSAQPDFDFKAVDDTKEISPKQASEARSLKSVVSKIDELNNKLASLNTKIAELNRIRATDAILPLRSEYGMTLESKKILLKEGDF